MLPADSSEARLISWLDQLGLWGNPFAVWNAERETNLPGYFVDVGQFDELLRWTEPCVLFAGRGCGKTAQRQMLVAQCRPARPDSARLAVSYAYTGFEQAYMAADNDVMRLRPHHHVAALLRQSLVALVDAARGDSRLESVLQRADVAARLTAYATRYAPHLAFIASGARTPASHSPVADGPAPIAETSSLTVETQTAWAPVLDKLSASEQLAGFVALAKACGLDSAVILTDGLDEFPLTAADPHQLAAFLAPLLGTLALIECPGVAFKFFLPSEMEPVLRGQPWFRPDRLRVLHIAWDDEALRALISQRLAFFSKSGGRTYSQLGELCSAELGDRVDRELVRLAGGQPRSALALADMLLRRHCFPANPPRLIAHETWQAVQVGWSALAADFQSPQHPTPAGSASEERKGEQSLSASNRPAVDLPILEVDEKAGRVRLGQRDITAEVRARDYRVLTSLHRRRAAVCDKELLIEEAWPDAEKGEGVTDQAIAAAIARLRKNLGQRTPERGYIETVKGRGYRLHPEGFSLH